MEGEKPQFEDFVKDLSLILKYDNTDIFRDAVIRYPYFQTGQLLYILSKNQIDSIFSDEEMFQAAIYSGNRAKLYYYLSNEKNLSESDELITNQSTTETKEYLTISEIITDQENIPVKQNLQKDEANSIIDKFISENPSMHKPTTEFFSPSNMAAKSIEDDDDLATETLAKIYIKKGNYAKAIKIYEKLMLYNPEKSNYFATLIKSLGDKINE